MSTILGGRAAKARAAMVIALVAVMVIATGVPFASAGWEATPYVAVSLDMAGEFQDERSSRPRISDDGRYIVFESRASLTADDVDDPSEDGELDVYHYDTMTRTLTLLTAARAGGTEDQRGSRDPDISDDGKYVSFVSGHDLVATDTNGDPDVYIYDTVNKTYKLLDIHGDSSPSVDDDWDHFRLSGNGMFVTFYTSDELFDEEYDGDSKRDVYRYDIASDETTLVSWPRVGESQDDRGSKAPNISDDGRYISFFSGRDFDDDDNNGDQDLYFWDAQTGMRTWADVTGDGSAVGDSAGTFNMSGNGNYVAFTAWDDVLPGDSNGKADVVLFDRVSEEATLVSQPQPGADQPNRGSRSPSLSDDGSTLVFMSGQDFVPEDTNGSPDFYGWDMATGEFTLYGIPQPYDPDLDNNYDNIWRPEVSGDGSTLVFESYPGFFDSRYDDDDHDDQIFYRSLEPPFEDGATRIAGANRYATAIAASKDTFMFGARTVVIATGANWPDALGGSALAGAVNGPVLLTTPTSLPDSVKAELMRLGATNAWILGGTGAVSADVESALNSMLPGSVKRLQGADRYETSQAVADKTIEILGQSYEGTVCVATGRNFADAMGAAPAAAGLGWPIILANPALMDVDIPAEAESAAILGGTAVVPAATMASVKTDLGDDNVVRVGGATRYDTAAMFAEHAVSQGLLWNGVGLATGSDFPDALAGGTALGLKRTVLLLTNSASLSPASEAKLAANKDDINSISILGGTAVVSDSVMAKAKAAAGL